MQEPEVGSCSFGHDMLQPEAGSYCLGHDMLFRKLVVVV